MRISDWSSDVCSSDLGPKSSSLCSPLIRRFAPPSPAGGRRVGVGSLRGLGKLLVQHLADFLLHRALQRGQQETELRGHRSEKHTSELPSLMRISYAVFCLKKKNKLQTHIRNKST